MSEAIKTLCELALRLGEERVAQECDQLAERVANGLFYVACIGQFKRGKSSILNALVGQEILPTGVVPVTSVITVLRFGAQPSARIQRAGQWTTVSLTELADYVTENRNPENTKNVSIVEVSLPSPLLANGLCLVDTPGIGSVFGGNTAVTQGFIPHIDAAIVVLGADPPITADEALLVCEASKRTQDIIAVVNKADMHPRHVLEEAAAFSAKVLRERYGTSLPAPFFISARDAQLTPNKFPGWHEFIRKLEALSRERGSDLVQKAEEAGVQRLGERLRATIRERLRALRSPLGEYEKRAGELERLQEEAQRAVETLPPLFDAIENQFAAWLDRERETYLRAAKEEAASTINTSATEGVGRDALLVGAQSFCQASVAGWKKRLDPAAEDMYRRSLDRFIQNAATLLEGLSRTSDSELGRLRSSIPVSEGFVERSRFFQTELLTVAPASLWARAIDTLRPASGKQRALASDTTKYAHRLLEANSSRAIFDLRDRLRESRRRVENQLRSSITDIGAIVKTALTSARDLVAQGQSAVDTETERLSMLERQIDSVVSGVGTQFKS